MSVKYYEWKCGNDIQTKITNRSYGTEQIHCLFSIDELFLWNRDPKKAIENLHYNKNIIYVLHHLYTRCSSGTKIRKIIPIKICITIKIIISVSFILMDFIVPEEHFVFSQCVEYWWAFHRNAWWIRLIKCCNVFRIKMWQ